MPDVHLIYPRVEECDIESLSSPPRSNYVLACRWTRIFNVGDAYILFKRMPELSLRNAL